MPTQTDNVISAAKACGATVILPGNVYNYGDTMPEYLHEGLPFLANNPLGKIRIDLENRYHQAQEHFQTIILRAGDFIEGHHSGNWFDGQITASLNKGKAVYPAARDVIHNWSYLPDMARAAELLTRRRSDLDTFENINFPSYSLTGEALINQFETYLGKQVKRKHIPWTIIRLLALFRDDLKGVVEMSFLWRTPHQMNSSKFDRLLPDFQPTPMNEAINQSLKCLGVNPVSS